MSCQCDSPSATIVQVCAGASTPRSRLVFGALVITVIGVPGYRTVVLQTETVLWIEHTHRVSVASRSRSVSPSIRGTA
jgi:hypothetical protein